MYNDYRVKSGAELSEYQKRIENIETVILCVSEAEKMISQIGSDLMPERPEGPEKKPDFRSRRRKLFGGSRSSTNESGRKNPTLRVKKKRIVSGVDI